MPKANRYYLFKAGRLVGPVSVEKIEEMRQNREIYQYSWMMSEEHQSWVPVDEMPTENPFQATLSTLKERTMSGAFLHRTHPISGIVKGIHSFGVELLIEGSKMLALLERSVHVLNLIDETRQKASNAEVVFQGQEKTPEGILLRFSWREAVAKL